jgi:CARDB
MSSNANDALVRAPRRLARALALVAMIIGAALAFSCGASAATGDPDPDPPPATAKPNLVVQSASVIPYGTSEWEVRYTVKNVGTTTAPAFHVAVQQNGSTEIKGTAHASLAPGTYRSETIHMLRPSCYLPIRVVADTTHVVTESAEFDNERWAVGIDGPTCPTQPQYRSRPFPSTPSTRAASTCPAPTSRTGSSTPSASRDGTVDCDAGLPGRRYRRHGVVQHLGGVPFTGLARAAPHRSAWASASSSGIMTSARSRPPCR